MSEDGRRRWSGPAGPAGGRELAAKARDKSKSPSSRAWIARQLNDPYVRRAKEEGWRARSAFKLLELDERFHFIKPGALVVDLGAAPGGWAQAVLKRGAAKAVGIDLLPIDSMPGAAFLEMDFLAPEAPGAIEAALGGKPDLVLSDMAANTTGHRRTDQIRTGALAAAAVDYAIAHLKPGGAFVTKAFQGGLEGEALMRLKHAFTRVRHAKPPASRLESAEVYVVATGRRGRTDEQRLRVRGDEP
ncbi:MAG: RlmE family RNA methyltransferase [Hyphomonadaceae bacterium]|nr:RlmE family RNA methyltransferase [Hyphomonadaceae bacterium]